MKVVWNILVLVALAVAAYFLWELLQLTFEISAKSEPPTSLFDKHADELNKYYKDSDHAQYRFLAASAVALFCFVFPRRHRGGGWIYVALMIAAATIGLALATYIPCAPDGNEFVPTIGWVIGIFEGDIEIAGPGAKCALAFSPGFELARGLAVILVAWALTYALRVVARKSLDRWRARISRDIDMVVGLDEVTLPLIKALIDERDRQDHWIDRRPGFLVGPRVARPAGVGVWHYGLWWLTGLRRGDLRRRLTGRTTVVVIDPTGSGSHEAELRAKGVRVLTGDPTSPEALEPFIINMRITGGRRLVLRRLYAVTGDQQVNLRVFRAAAEVLGEAAAPHSHRVVPRLYVRLGDEREARHWRLEHLQSRNYIADAITLDGAAATAVADRVLPRGDAAALPVDRLLIVGDSGLALALLEELAWRQWCAFELGQPVGSPREVLLLGANARARVREWQAGSASWRFAPGSERQGQGPELFTMPDADDDDQPWQRWERDWEEVAFADLGAAGRTYVVLVQPDERSTMAAARLSSAYPSAEPSVMLCSATATPWQDQVTDTGTVRFARTLAVIDASGRRLVPPDWVERLARQQHAVYLQDRAGDAVDPRRVLTHRPWDELPLYFRQDNVRQHWQILNGFGSTAPGETNWRWQRCADGDEALVDPGVLSEAVHVTAVGERRQWIDTRLGSGWWNAASRDARSDPLRMSVHVPADPSEDALPEPDVQLVREILARLWAAGLQPVPIRSSVQQSVR